MDRDLKKLFRDAKSLVLFAKERIRLEQHVKKLMHPSLKTLSPQQEALWLKGELSVPKTAAPKTSPRRGRR